MSGDIRVKQIKIEDINIEVVKKKIKNMYLRVYPPDGRVRISAPFKANNEAISRFALAKIAWIKRQQLKFQQKGLPEAALEYITGESHYLWGTKYLLNVVRTSGHPKVEIRDNRYIDLYIKENSEKKDRQGVLNEWYRQQLKTQLSPLVDKWQEIIGVQLSSWAIKNMKTKWGSCNISARRIWLNLQLVRRPPNCLEYVVVHEIVHLLSRYHDKRFKAFMDNYLPEWRRIKEELNNEDL